MPASLPDRTLSRRRSMDSIASPMSILPPPYALDDVAPNNYFSYIDPPRVFERAEGRAHDGEASGVIAAVSSAAQATQELARSVADIYDATTEARITGQDARALSGLLVTLQKSLLAGTLKPGTTESLNRALSTCLSTTRQLIVLIEPYTKSRARLTRRSLKSILSKPEVRELRAKWQQSKATLTNSLASIEKDANKRNPEADITQVNHDNDGPSTDAENLNLETTPQNEIQPTRTNTAESQGQLSKEADPGVHTPQQPTELAADEPSWARMSEPFSFEMPLAPPSFDADFESTPDSRTGPTISGTDSLREEPEATPDLYIDLKRVSRVSSEPTPRSARRSREAARLDPNPENEPPTPRSNTLPYHAAGRDPTLPRSNQHGSSPSLHQALIDEDMHQIITLLQTPDIDVNELGRHDRTPLHVCALLNDKVTAQTLLRTGRADLTRKDTHDRTPLHCALEVGNDGLACLLLQHGAPIEDLGHFIIDLNNRARKPAEEKVAHVCIAWLTKQNDLALENRFVNALVVRSGASAGGIARFLEGTPFRERYEARVRAKSGI